MAAGSPSARYVPVSVSADDVALQGEVGMIVGGSEYNGRVVKTYDDAPQGLSLLAGSAGYYEIIARQCSAAALTGVVVGDSVTLIPRV